jgi:mono/diheme cytochrome c family protein
MNRYTFISLMALLAFVVALPVYALMEPGRMVRAKIELREQYIEDGSRLYLRYCAACHGVAGEGIGVMPALDHPALASADEEALYRTIARAAHASTMAAWHVNEGGVLNDYQIGELVTVIQFADWKWVEQIADKTDYQLPQEPVAENGFAYMETEDEDDPHRCVSCHEEPEVHVGRFGINCARCHSSVAWTPAFLTKHNFALDHGGDGDVECQVCHVENYFTNTCYECHDHQPDEMEVVHLAEDLEVYDNCVECHPTGAAGEAELLMNAEDEPGVTELSLTSSK